MNQRTLALTALLLAILRAAVGHAGEAPPFVSPIFGDNMVLQRGKANAIWGWAKAGDEVQVKIGENSARAVTGFDGRWEVKIPAPPTGGPYTIKIDGPEHVEFHEVLVGDVWICGGQSNMQLPLSRTRDGDEEIKTAIHPEIRLYSVASHSAYSPAKTPKGHWKICTPESITEEGGFSAVGYYFGLRLQQDIHVPIGLVENCLGGTPAETWTSPESLHKLKDFDVGLAEVERLKDKGGAEYGNYVMHWYDEYDVGLKGATWAAPEFDDSAWKTVHIPGGFQELGVGDVPSVCWFRKEVTLPDPLPDGAAKIYLGVVEKMDTTYINGQWVGASSWVENPRVYQLNKRILKPGKNSVVIRVFKLKPNGGFMTKADGLKLTIGDNLTIPLAGNWKGGVSVDARPPHSLPLGFENYPIMPSVLYQGMLEPIAPLAITGVIWYQGEANADRAYQYRTLLPAMIGDWRRLFGQGDFPFYIVSLPAFMHHQSQPAESTWSELREAQALTTRAVANSALAVTIDTGDPDNIHPTDKKIVGERLALCAIGQHYGEKIVYQGPTYKSMEELTGALKLHFAHADGGLVCKGEKLGEFAVAGDDHKWHWADAKIEGDSVIVSSTEVSNPVAARYAWQSYPEATLYNGAGLPAVPFRTDNWPGITGGANPPN